MGAAPSVGPITDQTDPSQALGQALSQKDLKGLKNNKANPAQSAAVDKSSSAQVSLSQKAKQIKQATEIAKNDSVDEKRVAYFQNLIDSGKYKVDSSKVADRLVDDHMKMPT